MTPEARSALARRLLPLLDLTLLDEEARPPRIASLCARAQGSHGHVAAVCVYPEHVESARARLPMEIGVATVVNFPDAGEDPDRVAREIRRARAVGADEIDAVLPWRALAAGRDAPVLAVLRAAREAADSAILKIILETGALADAQLIARAAELALNAGADFLKTSTGKHGTGATPEAARILLAAIESQTGMAGLKASGGIRSLEQAQVYLELAERSFGVLQTGPRRLRFGASGLLDEIEQVLGGAAEFATEAGY
jgi:deoxyribose-phosphate aldolase